MPKGIHTSGLRYHGMVPTLSGHGHFDMVSYEKYLSGNLEDYECSAETIAEAMKDLPQVGAAKATESKERLNSRRSRI